MSQLLLGIKLDVSFAFLGLQSQVLLLKGTATGGNANKHMKRQNGQHIKRQKGPRVASDSLDSKYCFACVNFPAIGFCTVVYSFCSIVGDLM